MDKKRVYIKTFGCQMNVYDSRVMKNLLMNEGFVHVSLPDQADVIMVNTCIVRKHAEDRALSYIGTLKRWKKSGRILIISGCLSQYSKQGLLNRFEYVDIVLGPDDIYNIAELVKEGLANRKRRVEVNGCFEKRLPARYIDDKRLISYITVMTGCSNYCSYCIVPYVRGESKSRRIEDILEEAEGLVSNGTREIVLLGQSVNEYMKEGNGLPELFVKLDGLERLNRIRFITSHPKDLTVEIIKSVRDVPKVCEQVHMPVQSGSNSVLYNMCRGYTREYYLDLVGFMRKEVPGIAITTDIIVGFPGESEKDFEDTIDLVRKAGFDSAFTFKYSPRPGTRAADKPDDVPLAEKEKRLEELNRIIKAQLLERNASYIGTVKEVLVEGFDEKQDLYFGKTRSNMTVYFTGKHPYIGGIVLVKIEHSGAHSLRGVSET